MLSKIAITTTSFAEFDSSPIALCGAHGFEVSCNPFARKMNVREIIEIAKDAVGLIAGTELINRETLSNLPSLKVISRCGTGLDNIDLAAAKRLGIKVFNTPGAPTTAVAELTIGLILDSLRGISKSDRKIRQGIWEKEMGVLLEGKTVGIIGLGRIGKAVSRILCAFDAEVIAHDKAKDQKAGRVKLVSFNKLIANSDIVSLHLSFSNKNRHIIGSKEIESMKRGCFIINTSRGGLIDGKALYSALKSGKLKGAAIDVFEEEPYHGKLTELDNVVLTSHIGSYAKEARVKMELEAVKNLLRGLNKL